MYPSLLLFHSPAVIFDLLQFLHVFPMAGLNSQWQFSYVRLSTYDRVLIAVLFCLMSLLKSSFLFSPLLLLTAIIGSHFLLIPKIWLLAVPAVTAALVF